MPHRCVRRKCTSGHFSASSPTRSLRSVAGAAASGRITLVVMPIRFFFFAQEASSVCGAQGSCYMPDGEGLEGFGDNSPPPNLMGVTGGNMSPISTCRTEPGPSVIGTRQGQTPRLRGVCVCTAPSHRPRHHTLPELRTRHSTANISALHTQLVQQLLRCPL